MGIFLLVILLALGIAFWKEALAILVVMLIFVTVAEKVTWVQERLGIDTTDKKVVHMVFDTGDVNYVYLKIKNDDRRYLSDVMVRCDQWRSEKIMGYVGRGETIDAKLVLWGYETLDPNTCRVSYSEHKK